MKKFMLTALVGASALAFSAGAWAEGEATIRSESQFNSSATSAPADNSVARGAVELNKEDNSITATSTTGTQAGTGSVTIDADNPDIDARAGANVSANSAAEGDNDMEEDRAEVNDAMDSEAGVMRTRAAGAMGMLNPTEVRQVQSNLIQAGYNLQADGIYGPRTKDALKRYQEQNDLPVTGLFDAETQASFKAKMDQSNTGPYGGNN